MLDKIFKPKSIAVIGASTKKGSVGYDLFANVNNESFKGKVFAVNFKRKKVQGVDAYKTISDIPTKVDLAIIATPAKTVPFVVEECGRVGVKGIVIISAGFTEAGTEGKKMSKQILETAHRYKMRVIGPNCLGFLHPSIGLNASFATKSAKPGKLAFISQSGALCTSILDWAQQDNIGFSHFVSIGSMIDVGFHDLIEYLGRDKETSAILIYMESLANSAKFLEVARKVVTKKPIIVLKVGRSVEGSQAAKSHTGSLTGNDIVFDAAFASAGIVRANTIWSLFGCAKLLAMQKNAASNELTVITNAGGPGVIATDALIAGEGKLSQLSKSTKEKLDNILPLSWSHANPIDILGDATPERYAQTIKICVNDSNVQSVLILLTPQSMTNPTEVARQIVKIPNLKKKMIFACWMGGNDVTEGTKILENHNIPTFNLPEAAIKSFTNIQKYTMSLRGAKQRSNLGREINTNTIKSFKPKTDQNKKIVELVRQEKRRAFTESEAKEFLANYGIKSAKHFIATTKSEAGNMSDKTGFPVAIKILSPDILHKVDVGGVILNINSKTEVMAAFAKIMKSVKSKKPKADIRGVSIERMTKGDFELLIGCKKDPIFGHVIVFGTGGTTVEVYNDTNLALVPLMKGEALKLMQNTKIFKMLKGFRGKSGADLKYLQDILYKFSKLIEDFPEISELDMNPFVVTGKNGVVLDAKIVIE